MLYFSDAAENMEPVDIFHVVAQWTLKAIGHLFKASIYTYGTAPSILSRWIFNYIVGRIEVVFNDLPVKFWISNLQITYLQCT